MRCGQRVFLALLGLLPLLEAGCLRQWGAANPNANYAHDPLLQRRDFPPGYPPPGYPPYQPGVQGSFGAGVGVDPGRPEVLTPQAPPLEPAPSGGMPPNSS